MLVPVLRPSTRAVQLISAIERSTGRWERSLSQSSESRSKGMSSALSIGCLAACCLDVTSDPVNGIIEHTVDEGSLKLAEKNYSFRHLLSCHRLSPALSLNELNRLFLKLNPVYEDELNSKESPLPYSRQPTGLLRRQAGYFGSPQQYVRGDIRVFPTLAPYMIPSRLNELLSWTSTCLSKNQEHPLLVIAVFHLMFLQIHPYPTANHRLAMLLVWQMLKDNGYEFVQHSHFAPQWLKRAAEYYQCLHQAEKTALEAWGTFNIWLEFFLETLLETIELLLEASLHTEKAQRLTSVQSRILDSIRSNGFARRELISNETGIKLSTVKYNLAVLQDRGLIIRRGAGRTAGYELKW